MEGITVLYGILTIVFAILSLILFFKIWGLTNTVRDIKSILQSLFEKQDGGQSSKEFNKIDNPFGFGIGDLVVHTATGKQMRIKDINSDGAFACYTNSGMTYEGTFPGEELQLFKK